MSSNPYHNDPVITRSNYEEYLLLYIDDELTAEEKAAVDRFLLLNPDLQQELDLLMQTKLPLELFPMEEKETLLAGSMQEKASEEDLLLYIDNELDEAKRKSVEDALEKDVAYRLQYEVLLKTKSDPGEKIVYPFKKDLYRRKQRRIPVLYWRAAAAVLLVVSIGTFIRTDQQQRPEEVAIVPSGNQSQKEISSPGMNQPVSAQPLDEIAKEKTGTSAAIDHPGATDHKGAPVIAMQKKVVEKEERQAVNKNATVNTHLQPVTPEGDREIVSIRQRQNDAPVLVPEKVEDPVSKPLTDNLVTSEPVYTYNNTNAPVNAVPAVAYEEEKSKPSLKGLLRKATRYVERRTNINVTNENEELLIGSVAISLK